MRAGTRIITAALVGALCGVGWVSSIRPATDLVCGGDSLSCIGTFLIMLPVMTIVWMLLGWGLLKVARFDPAWHTGIGGPAGTVLTIIVTGFVTDLLDTAIPSGSGLAAFAVITGAGYALAAAAAARYGVPRDRIEHRGQDR